MTATDSNREALFEQARRLIWQQRDQKITVNGLAEQLHALGLTEEEAQFFVEQRAEVIAYYEQVGFTEDVSDPVETANPPSDPLPPPQVEQASPPVAEEVLVLASPTHHETPVPEEKSVSATATPPETEQPIPKPSISTPQYHSLSSNSRRRNAVGIVFVVMGGVIVYTTTGSSYSMGALRLLLGLSLLFGKRKT